MREGDPFVNDKAMRGLQIFLLVCFYMFALGVFIFLGSAVYRSVVNHDHPVHAVIMSSVVTFAFLILTSVMTMVFTVIIKEGQKKVRKNGGPVNESEI